MGPNLDRAGVDEVLGLRFAVDVEQLLAADPLALFLQRPAEGSAVDRVGELRAARGVESKSSQDFVLVSTFALAGTAVF